MTVFHSSPLHIPILSQMNPLHTLSSCLLKPSFILYIHLGLPVGHAPLVFPPETLYMFQFPPMHAVYPTHLILLDLIT